MATCSNYHRELYDIFFLAIDFSVGDQTLTFSTGNTIGIERCGTANITDDSVVENNETFIVFFMTTDPVVEFVPDQSPQTLVTIIDNDGEIIATV